MAVGCREGRRMLCRGRTPEEKMLGRVCKAMELKEKEWKVFKMPERVAASWEGRRMR